MANNRREVWEKAQQTGCDQFISKVSAVFGKDAIADVCIESGMDIISTSDQFAMYNPTRVIPGTTVDAKDSKEIRASRK